MEKVVLHANKLMTSSMLQPRNVSHAINIMNGTNKTEPVNDFQLTQVTLMPVNLFQEKLEVESLV